MKSYIIAAMALAHSITIAAEPPARGNPTNTASPVLALPPRPDRSEAIESFRAHPFGMFIHYGLYSAYGGVYQEKPVKTTYLEQMMGRAGIPRDEFMAAAATFDLGQFDADAICRLAKDTGMTQIVLTTKHHDGFCMFRTKMTPRNIVDMGPSHRDPVAELAAACARHKLAMGLYYSIVDWSEGSGFDWNNDNPVSNELVDYECAQLKELLTQYGPVSQVWFDMGRPTSAQSRRLAETVWRLQPACAVNGRVWNEQGDFITLGDNEIATGVVREPCQSAASIEHATWGYCSWLAHAVDAKTKGLEKVRELSRVVAHGGSYLLNIGPQGSGAVDPYEREVLESVGAWMRVHGEAVSGTTAVDFFGRLPWGGATTKGKRLYLHVHDPAKVGPDGLRLPGMVTRIVKARLFGGGELTVSTKDGESCIAWDAARAKKDELPVIALDLDGPPVVLPPAPAQPKPGVFVLEKPYSRLNRNGSGYYHKSTLRSLAYDFCLPDAGERQMILRLANGAAEESALRVRVTTGGKALSDRVIPIPVGVGYLDLGRLDIAANMAVQVSLESEIDRPGGILPVSPQLLYLSDPKIAAGPAQLWQK